MKELIVLIISLVAFSSVQADELDQKIQAEMSRQHVPGLTIAIVQHGKIIRLGAYGFADLEWNAKTTNHTRFEIASISKMFTGAAARILIEQGKLDPEDSVSKYFEGTPESWKMMKLRHLLTMSTGLDEDWGSDLIPYKADVISPDNDADLLKMFMQMKPVAPVGMEFHYSSPGYAMLGMIVAKVSGEPLAKFIDENIFKPAGMTESSFIDNSAIVPERAQGYRTENGKLLKGWYLGQYLHSRPDCGILTTAQDLAKWVIALEQRKIVKDPEKLWEGSTGDSGKYLDYSYGWQIETFLGHRRVSHSGGYRTGFHTFLARYIDDDLSIIALSNCDFSDVRNYIFSATLHYLKGIPDPKVLAGKKDENPEETEELKSLLQLLAQGKMDSRLAYDDAFEPYGLAGLQDFLKTLQSTDFAGRSKISGLHIHNRTLVDYETLKIKISDGEYYVTLYRNEHGKIAYVELTT